MQPDPALEKSPYKDKITVHATHDSDTPLVFFFGFATSQTHNLEKFNKIYEKIQFNGQSFESILLCPTIFQLYSHSNNLKLSFYLWALINQYCQKTRPLIFHVFSGSSFLFHAMLLLLEQNPKLMNKIKNCWAGIVWDSSPIYPDEDIAAKATAPLMDSWNMPRILWYPLLSYGVIPLYWVYDFGSYSNALKYRENYWIKMRSFPIDYKLPQLYIYSTKDTITCGDHLDRLFDELKQNEQIKEIVFRKRYEDTIHVQHFKRHPEDYNCTVVTFIHTCLKLWEQRTKDTSIDIVSAANENVLIGSKL